MRRDEIETVAVAGGEPARALVVSLLERLEAQAERHQREVARLEARIARLEEQTRSSSRNSSKPPSQDPPKTRKERRAEARAKAKEWAKADREGAGRKAGGQPGHRGSGRKLLPEDRVDEIIDHDPDGCGGCGHEFGEPERLRSRRPARHQVSELPAVAVVVTEHRSHRLRCPRCRAKTKGVLPGEVAGSAFGPGLQAAVVTMTARNRVSRRDMSELASDLFGLWLSVGSVDAICRSAAAILASPHEALVDSVLGSSALNVDETGWATSGEGRTLWTATTPRAAIFRIAEDRHRDRLDELIGGFEGIVCSDRWWAYDHRRRLPPGLLAASQARLSPPRSGTGRAEGLRRGRPCAHRQAVRGLARLGRARGPPPPHARSSRSQPSCATCSSMRRARAPAPATTAGLPATC